MNKKISWLWPSCFLVALACLPAKVALSSQPLAPLTAADVIGPNGLMMPDFTRAGVPSGIPGGIPSVAVAARAADFGAIPDDGADDSVAIQKAVDSLGENGAVLLDAGRFDIDATINIRRNNVVIRGAGRGQTVIAPRFEGQALDKQGDAPRVAVFNFEGATHPKRARGLLMAPVKRGDTSIRLREATGFLPGEVAWIAAQKIPAETFAILGPKLRKLSQGGYERAQAGKYFGWQWRMSAAVVTRVEGDTVYLDRPLRADLPLDVEPIADMNNLSLRGCGLENLSIEQDAEKFAIDGIRFERTYGCWVRDVEVKKIGSWPMGIARSLNFQVENVDFDDDRSRGGGGVGYFGIDFSAEGLVQNSRFSRLRHVSVSNLSNGIVVRNCVLANVDINFHMNFPGETLWENNTVDAGPGEDESRGSYQVGIYTPRYYGDIHQPDAGSHVFWHNDIKSIRGGVALGGGGSSRNIFAYNRFQVAERAGAWIRQQSDDNLFLGNVFALKNYNVPFAPWEQYQYEDNQSRELGGVVFLSGPASGNRFLDNTFTGVSQDKLFVGQGAPAEDKGNVARAQYSVPDLPTPPVESLYEWQLAHKQAKNERP